MSVTASPVQEWSAENPEKETITEAGSEVECRDQEKSVKQSGTYVPFDAWRSCISIFGYSVFKFDPAKIWPMPLVVMTEHLSGAVSAAVFTGLSASSSQA